MYARATGVLYVFTLILEVRLLFIKSLHMNLIPHRHSNLICQVTQASYTGGIIDLFCFPFWTLHIQAPRIPIHNIVAFLCGTNTMKEDKSEIHTVASLFIHTVARDGYVWPLLFQEMFWYHTDQTASFARIGYEQESRLRGSSFSIQQGPSTRCLL